MSLPKRRVGAVVLTYNSTDDLPDCFESLIRQLGVDLRVIVVDNASRPEERARMEEIFHSFFPDGEVMNTDTAPTTESRAVFLGNTLNVGYSAGNNIGARFAVARDCESVLIINPDVRIEDPQYIISLADLIAKDGKTAVACSDVSNLAGQHENPKIEPRFVEELLWPLKMIFGQFLPKTDAKFTPLAIPFQVEKVTGACFLIRSDFLRLIDFFDESVFLYCEESILCAQVRQAGWHMLMDPSRYALHSHRSEAKGDPLPRFQLWAESRARYHAQYSGYGMMKRAMLAGSRCVMLGLVTLKSALKKRRAVQIRSQESR